MRKLLLATMLFAARVDARPQEAIDTDRSEAAAELSDLDRRATSLDEQIGQRRQALRQRIRALYKLTQGGALQLLVEADSPLQVAERLEGASRVVGRDLREIGALGDEVEELGRDRTLRVEQAQRSAALDRSRNDPAVGLEVRRGDLYRPVPGPIVTRLSHTRVAASTGSAPAVELPRRAIELETTPGEAVRASARGTVRWVGPIDGLGQVVVIDHGDHYATLTGRLRAPSVTVGSDVKEGQSIGRAEGSTITFELSESRTALDPARWIRPPAPPHVVGPTHAAVDLVHGAPL